MEMIRDKLDPWVGRGMGGVKRRVACPLSLLLLLRGLTSSAGCQKKETPSLPEDGLEQQRGARRRWTFCDLLPECTWLCYAEVQMLLNHLFCPCNALMLLHSHTHSLCQRDDDDGQVLSETGRFILMASIFNLCHSEQRALSSR